MANLDTRRMKELVKEALELIILGKSFEFNLLLTKLKGMRFSLYVESGVCCRKVGEKCPFTLRVE